MKLTIHTDGGARGNPGPAAIGVVIEEAIINHQSTITNSKLIHEFGRRIGETTNNVAEYTAVIEALTYLKTNPESRIPNPEINFFLDSTLVVNQINGLFKVKEPHLRELLFRVRTLEQEIGGIITYMIVPREQNRRADILVNDALDRKAQ